MSTIITFNQMEECPEENARRGRSDQNVSRTPAGGHLKGNVRDAVQHCPSCRVRPPYTVLEARRQAGSDFQLRAGSARSRSGTWAPPQQAEAVTGRVWPARQAGQARRHGGTVAIRHGPQLPRLSSVSLYLILELQDASSVGPYHVLPDGGRQSAVSNQRRAEVWAGELALGGEQSQWRPVVTRRCGTPLPSRPPRQPSLTIWVSAAATGCGATAGAATGGCRSQHSQLHSRLY